MSIILNKDVKKTSQAPMDLELEEHCKIGFYTATILEWKNLLKPDKYKDVITNSLRFIVEAKRAKIYGFVIMPNHLHLLWKIALQ